GVGTTFTIYLPATEPEAPLVLPESGGGEGEAVPRVLLVEPDIHIRGLMASTLESIGYEVVIDGPAALAREDVSLVVVGNVDLGPSGSKERRAFESRVRATPAVVLGSRCEEALREDGLTGPVVLARPFRMVDFKSAVRAALERGKGLGIGDIGD
ncbi:MAG: hypothetical protein KDA21_14620, partial [Phycisphaerales bacterium]|nr:hypothetical protein [Phycisphaerales bacterium]